MPASSKILKIIILVLSAAVSSLSSSEINVKDVTELISADVEQIGGGFIQNLQLAPFDNNLVSFEVTYDNDPTIKLFLFNVETRNIFQVSSEAYAGGSSKTKKRYYIKDVGLQWHPYKNWFVFSGNGMGGREQMYICRVVVPELINNYAVNGYRISLDENTKEEKSFLIDPTFDMTGDRVLFSRRIIKRDKKAKYNRTYNITMIKDIFSYKDFKFKNVEFETVLDKRFDQLNPLCSPSDKDLVAFISYKNQKKKGEEYYHEYSISILNLSTSEVVVVDNLDGYRSYPYRWSNTGSQLFYMKALSLLRTPQSFIDDKMNQVNLHFARIEKAGNKFSVYLQTNPKTDILVNDIVTTRNSLFMINDNNIILPKWHNNIPSLYIVDINMWRSSDKNYAKMIDFKKDIDTDFPILIGNELYYISTSYAKSKALSSITVSGVEVILSGGEKQDIAGRKAEMDSGDMAAGDEYSDDESFDDSFDDYGGGDEEEETVQVVKKPDNSVKIQELEKKISLLETEASKIENKIASENIIFEENDNNIRNLTRQSNELLDEKNSLLEKINSLREMQTRKLLGEKEIALKQAEITKYRNDVLRLENEVLELENQIITEKDKLDRHEKTYADYNDQIAKLNTTISDLKIEKTKNLQAENKLSSFMDQLSELENKKSSLDTEIDELEKKVTLDGLELTKLENQLTKMISEKSEAAKSVEKLIADKARSEQQDLQASVTAKNTELSSYKKKLAELEKELDELDKVYDSENKNISDLTKKIKELNDSKTGMLGEIASLQTKKADQAKLDDKKKVEENKAEEKTVAAKDEYEDDEYEDEEYEEYDDDSEISDDVFEKIETQSSGRRGRR
ncbi:MAG TPA: hypothetical protein PKW56_00865 [Clostridiales bacterium]|nr:hypothetical protein [Clostridiales bacterium]